MASSSLLSWPSKALLFGFLGKSCCSRGGKVPRRRLISELDNRELGGITPDTVKTNVKNLHGWKGGAERGFLAEYPDCVQTITQQAPPELLTTMTKALTANLKGSVVGQRYGMLAPIAFYLSILSKGRKPSRDKMKPAHVLGWSVEMLRAANIVTDNTLGSTGANFNIVRTAVKPTSQEDSKGNAEQVGENKSSIGMAFNDALMLEHAAKILVKHAVSCLATTNEFYEKNRLEENLMSCLTESINQMSLGRALELQYSQAACQKRDKGGSAVVDLTFYDLGKYKTLIKCKASQLNYCLPVSFALHLSGTSQKNAHDEVHKILQDLGFLLQLQRDYTDCFSPVEAERGMAIEKGRLTWLLVYACQMASAAQKQVLNECYGDSDPHNVAAVKEIYGKLKLKKQMEKALADEKANVFTRIQSISKLEDFGITPKFFFNLMEDMVINEIL